MKTLKPYQLDGALTGRQSSNGNRQTVHGSPVGESQQISLPDDALLHELLGLAETGCVADILKATLLGPVSEIAGNRGKRIRAQLVHLGCRLLSDRGEPSVAVTKRCEICADVVEYIHAGSLVVDDIEDGSRVRRGHPALHIRYGVPIALNAGNWLYFWPLQLIKEAGFSPDQKLSIHELYDRTLLRAHFGQAVDLGARVDLLPQSQVPDTCIAAMTLKTGALMGFAAAMGGAIAGAPARAWSVLEEFGRELGVVLQMFDDLGNVTGAREPSKKYEDLMLYRPSWAWACAARSAGDPGYREFVSAVAQLPEAAALEQWLGEYDLLALGRKSAMGHLDLAFARLESALANDVGHWSRWAFNELRELGEEIALAYG